MTDPHTPSDSYPEIDDQPRATTDDLSIAAQRLIDQDDALRSFQPRRLRQAVREDAVAVRGWGSARVGGFRHAVENRPMQATLYALGIGVVIGQLAAR